MYPTNIPDWRDLLLAYQPPEDHAEAINRAQMAANIVPQCVEVFNALKNAPGLSQDGLRLLVGAAHLIASSAWNGMGTEAAMLIGQRARDVMPPETPPSSEIN